MGKDSSEIRREIEQTRARMGDTVEALAYKSDVPARVKDAVNDKVATVKGTIADVVDNVKDTLTGTTGKVGHALGDASRSAGSAWTDTTDKLGETTSNVTSSISEKISAVSGDVSGKLGDVTGRLPSGEDVKDVARRGAGIVMENPLGLALGGLAVGLLAGLLAPVTDIERKTVGPIRDDLVEKAQSIGSDMLEHGKQIVQETAQSALHAAQAHGAQVVGEAQGRSDHQAAAQGGTPASGGTKGAQYGVLLDDERDSASAAGASRTTSS